MVLSQYNIGAEFYQYRILSLPDHPRMSTTGKVYPHLWYVFLSWIAPHYVLIKFNLDTSLLRVTPLKWVLVDLVMCL